MNSQLAVPEDACASFFCRKRGIKRLSIFGSALQEDFGPESHVDIAGGTVQGPAAQADDGGDTGGGVGMAGLA